MLPGVVSYGQLTFPSAAVSFKGAAAISGGYLQIFQDTGAAYTEVFSLADSGIVDIELGSNDLVARRNSFPYLRVYSWNGTTFAQTWEMNPTLFLNNVPTTVSISSDGNRIHYGCPGTSGAYANPGFGIILRQGNGSYAQEAYVLASASVASVAVDSGGDYVFANRGNNVAAGMYRNIGAGGGWSSFAGVGTAPFGNDMPSASSRIITAASNLYRATLSTSSPYICIYRSLTTTGGNFRLGNPSSLPPSTYVGQAIDVSDDGSYICYAYQASTTANGNIRIYGRSSDTAFSTLAYDPGSVSNGRIVGCSFNGDATKLFAARAYTGATTDQIWVYTRSGSTWSQTGSIQTRSYFTPASMACRTISAN